MVAGDPDALAALLTAGGAKVRLLDLGQGIRLLASDRGGRVYGPFLPDATCPDWRPADADLVAALASGDWNLGGERVWIAPEGLFNFTDPARMLDSYRVPAQMDPGLWEMTAQGAGVSFTMAASVPLAGCGGCVGVRLGRDVMPIAARHDGGVTITGYRQHLSVAQTSGIRLPLVPWLIRQVAPGGAAWLDALPGAVGDTVFGAPPDAALIAGDGAWHVPFSGPGFFKTAYHRRGVGQGRLGWTGHGPLAFTLVCSPRLAQAEAYPETLPGRPQTAGLCASLFYDDGRFGTYGELELYGHHAGGGGTLTVETLILTGPEDRVGRTARAILPSA